MSYGYIYKITNTINGRIYIGQHKGTFTHEYLGSGKIIKQAVDKHGKKNFKLEVLAFATTKPMLDGLERKYIYEYRQVFGREFLYNIMDGGDGWSGPRSEETKTKISLSLSGKVFSEETKKKLSLASLGKPKSEKARNNMKFAKRPPISEETKKRMGASRLGKHHSEEVKKTTYSPEELKDELKSEILELTSELLFQMGFGSIYRELLYNTIMNHIDKKIFNGKTLGLATEKDLEFALYKIPEIRRVFMKPGLVPSIIRYPYEAK